MNNTNLHNAKRAKNDEFYTQLSDIKNECQHYTQHFEGKWIYLPCDDETSNFWVYFVDHFHEFRLRHLTATHINFEGRSYRLDYDGFEITKTDLEGNGDFRSEECTKIKDELVFSADAIESMAKKFMKNFRQKNVTLQHEEDAEGIYMVEQWIKTDASHDKSVALGFSADIPTGTWFQTYYVDSNEIWNRITSGELRGFSLECVLGVEEFEKQIASFEADEPPVAAEPVSNEVVEEQPDTSAKVVEPVANDPEVPVKESILDKILRVLNPTIQKVEEEKVTTEPEPEPIKEEEKKDESQIEETSQPDEVVEEKKEELPNPLEDVVKNLKAEIESLKENNTRLLEKVRDLSGMPSVKPTNTNPNGNGGNESTYAQWREQVRKMIG